MSEEKFDGINLMDFSEPNNDDNNNDVVENDDVVVDNTQDDEIIEIVDDDDEIDELIGIIEEEHIPDTPVSEAEFKNAEKITSISDEVASQNKEELDSLDPPLIVHRKSDASYQETASDNSMEETHTEDDGPTLTRHRFKKEKKNNNKPWVTVILVLLIIAVVFAGLYYTGVINPEKETTTSVETTTEVTTSLEQAYEGKILIKGTFIFVDGIEVNGLEGLGNALKYVDPSPTAYEIVKENADSAFLNDNVLPMLLDLGFYGEDTVISTVAKSGLMAQSETTTKATTTTTTTTTTTQATNE